MNTPTITWTQEGDGTIIFRGSRFRKVIIVPLAEGYEVHARDEAGDYTTRRFKSADEALNYTERALAGSAAGKERGR